MSIKIHPSPALIVHADATISDCIHLMNDQQVGSVLVVNNYPPEELVGIFTERDLLSQVQLIRSGDHWSKPIRTVMTHPIWTLDISELEQAADLMIQRRVRHVPITIQKKPEDTKGLVGVLSMRDLFKKMIQNQKSPGSFFDASLLKEKQKLAANLVSKDSHLVHFLEQTLHFYLNADVHLINIESDILKPASVFVIDLDKIDVSLWLKVLIAKNQDPLIKMIMIVFNPALQTNSINQILGSIKKSEKFWILKKPIDLARFYEALNSLKIK